LIGLARFRAWLMNLFLKPSLRDMLLKRYGDAVANVAARGYPLDRERPLRGPWHLWITVDFADGGRLNEEIDVDLFEGKVIE